MADRTASAACHFEESYVRIDQHMELVNCNLCGSDRWRKVYTKPDVGFFRSLDSRRNPKEWFDVVECNNCGLGFVNPRPTRSEMSLYYPREFFQYFHDQASFHQRRYAAEASFLADISRDCRKPRLLDIGCAGGEFPRFMQRFGWEVEGVEIADSADPITDFPIHEGEFPNISLDEPSYDAITAWAVLEHVHDPAAHFRKAGRLLKPGGKFVFLVTNFASTSSRHLFREDIPRHLYFFTKGTVKQYLELAGLKLDQAVYDDSIYGMQPANWMRYLLYKLILHRNMEWSDLPPTRADFLEDSHLQDNFVNKVRYICQYPAPAFDRLWMPLYEKLQIWTNSYGIATYVASRV